MLKRVQRSGVGDLHDIFVLKALGFGFRPTHVCFLPVVLVLLLVLLSRLDIRTAMFFLPQSDIEQRDNCSCSERKRRNGETRMGTVGDIYSRTVGRRLLQADCAAKLFQRAEGLLKALKHVILN